MFDRTPNEATRAARQVITDMTRIGATLPPEIAAAVEAKDREQTGLRTLLEHGTDAKLTDLAAARVKGQKVNQSELTDVLLGAALAARPQAQDGITRAADSVIGHALRDNADAVVDALRPTFDQAAAAIGAARGVLGDVDLDDLAAVTAKGGDAAQHWQDAKAATERIHQVKTVIERLAAAGGYPKTADPREKWLPLLDVDLPGYKTLTRDATAWDAARAGTLSLAGPTEYQARLAALDQAWGRDPKNPATRLGPGVGQHPTDRAPADVIGGAL